MLDSINEKLKRLCRSVNWDTGYVMESADSRFKIEKDGNKVFASASIIKLNILWSVYKRISTGLLSSDRLIVTEGKDIVGGSGVLSRLNPGHSLTIRELCALMIDFSDNTATNILINLLGMEFINSDIIYCGLANTVLQRRMMDFEARSRGIDNLTTPGDVVRILRHIETSEDIKPELRKDMLDILHSQDCKNYLTQYMPKGFSFAHKSGSLDDVLHDAGILFTENGQCFYIAVMTSGFPNFESGLRFINRFGAELFECFI